MGSTQIILRVATCICVAPSIILDYSKDFGDSDPFSETTSHVSNSNWNGNKHSSSQKLNLCEVNKYLL